MFISPKHLRPLFTYFLRPIQILRTYSPDYLRPDLLAGLTVAVILLPQAIAHALIVELPPERGLYTAIVGAIVAALWGSSAQMHSGSTNAIALLLLAVLTSVGITPESPDFLLALGLIAVMVGVFQIVMGLARLGLLVNFVSDSVIVGFTAGAGVLIMASQLRHFFGLQVSSSPELLKTLEIIVSHLGETHRPSVVIGFGTLILMALLKRYTPKWPGLLIVMVTASTIAGVLKLDQTGLRVIGRIPQSLPPLADLPLLDLELIGRLSTGALAVAAIGLVSAVSIARSISGQTGQSLDSNQEFIGQGLANVASGFFSGFAGSGSFARSAVNFSAGARTPLASVFSGVLVLVAMLLIAPLASYIPRAALAGALIFIGFGMIDRQEMTRIFRSTRGDTLIMLSTLLGTLFLNLEFAVLIGIIISLVRYVIKTSVPKVFTVLPDDDYNHLIPRSDRPACPQLVIMDILGDLYFGAINHVEQMLRQNMIDHPEQRFLLLRMRGVFHCDISGIHMLENLMRTYREQGGDLYLMRVQETVKTFMDSTGFCDKLGADHFLPDDGAVTHLFYHVLDPAVCIYECEVRAFSECQNLPKQTFMMPITLHTEVPTEQVSEVSPQSLWDLFHTEDEPPMVIDVREPREFRRGHIPYAELKPLSDLIANSLDIMPHQPIILVCRSGRRSIRAAHILKERGFDQVSILQGGMLAWEAAGLLEAIEDSYATAFAGTGERVP